MFITTLQNHASIIFDLHCDAVWNSSDEGPQYKCTHTVAQTKLSHAASISPIHYPPSPLYKWSTLCSRSLNSAKCYFEINTCEAHLTKWCNNRGRLLLPSYRETGEKTLSQVCCLCHCRECLRHKAQTCFSLVAVHFMSQYVTKNEKQIILSLTKSYSSSMLYKNKIFSYHFLELNLKLLCLIFEVFF